MVLQFIGTQRSKPRVKQVLLAACSLLWSKPLSMCMVFVLSFEWWGFQLRSLRLCLGTTNRFWPTQQLQRQLWRRNPMPLRITLSMRAVPGMNGERHISICMIMSPTCLQSCYLQGRSGASLCVCCCIICNVQWQHPRERITTDSKGFEPLPAHSWWAFDLYFIFPIGVLFFYEVATQHCILSYVWMEVSHVGLRGVFEYAVMSDSLHAYSDDIVILWRIFQVSVEHLCRAVSLTDTTLSNFSQS